MAVPVPWAAGAVCDVPPTSLAALAPLVTMHQRWLSHHLCLPVCFLMEKDRADETAGEVGGVIAGLPRAVNRLTVHYLLNPSTHLESTWARELEEAEVEGRGGRMRNKCVSHMTNQGDSTPWAGDQLLRGVLKNTIFILSGAEKLLQGSVMKAH